MVAGYTHRTRALAPVGWEPSTSPKTQCCPVTYLKVLSVKLSGDPGFLRERFVREADIASSSDHPNIVSICGRGESRRRAPRIAMKYVPGTDAEAALRAGTMTPIRAVHIVGEGSQSAGFRAPAQWVTPRRQAGQPPLRRGWRRRKGPTGRFRNCMLPRRCRKSSMDRVVGRPRAGLRRSEVIAGGPIDESGRPVFVGLHAVSDADRQETVLRGRWNGRRDDGPSARRPAHLGTSAVGAAAAGLGDHEGVGPRTRYSGFSLPGNSPCRRRGGLHEAVPAVVPPQPARSCRPSPSVDHTRDRGGGAKAGHFGTPASVSPYRRGG